MPRRLLMRNDGVADSTAPEGYQFMGLNQDGKLRLVEGSNQKDLLGDSSGNIEIKSIEEGDGSVTPETLEFNKVGQSFEADTIVVGTYTGVQPTGGSGDGLEVTVVVGGEETAIIDSVTVTAGGSGYEIGDVVSIATSELGADPSNESTTYTLRTGDLNLTKEQSIRVTPDGIFIDNLTTSEPEVAGQLWNDNGTLKISIDLG